jgi:hypothetical protein
MSEDMSTLSEIKRGGAPRKQQGNRKPAPVKVPTPAQRLTKFEGRCEDLKGHICDCKGTGQADQFMKQIKQFPVTSDVHISKELTQRLKISGCQQSQSRKT